MITPRLIFSEDPVTRPVRSTRRLVELVRRFHWTWRGVKLCVDAGFQFDGSTIPFLCHRLIGEPLAWPWITLAVPHDGNYDGAVMLAPAPGCRPTPVWFTPAENDAVFGAGMALFKVRWWRRWLAYSGIRTHAVCLGRLSYTTWKEFLVEHPDGMAFSEAVRLRKKETAT